MAANSKIELANPIISARELWLPVRNYEGWYQVSSLGRVRRVRQCRGAQAMRILRPKPPGRNSDYCRVQLCKRDVKRLFTVHSLVAEAFHGSRPRNKFVNHIDLNKTNNAASNLEWLTRKQNAQHAIRNGAVKNTGCCREKNGRAKLTEDQIEVIRSVNGIIGQRKLAILCGVSKTLIQRIHQGKLWPEDLRVRQMPEIVR